MLFERTKPDEPMTSRRRQLLIYFGLTDAAEGSSSPTPQSLPSLRGRIFFGLAAGVVSGVLFVLLTGNSVKDGAVFAVLLALVMIAHTAVVDWNQRRNPPPP